MLKDIPSLVFEHMQSIHCIPTKTLKDFSLHKLKILKPFKKWGPIQGIFSRKEPFPRRQCNSLIKSGLPPLDDGRFVDTKETDTPTMETLVRNATLSFSRRYNFYQVLDKCNNNTRSKRKVVVASLSNSQEPSVPLNKVSYQHRRERAKKRQIFLQSYNLSFQSRRSNGQDLIGREEPLSVKLKRNLVKVKTGVVSILRWNAFRGCSRRGSSVLCFSSPKPVSSVTPLSTPPR